ncbi:MAG: hypothetical protein JWQ42_1554, partial [Edaphobacter sp.]|nr:hypothetical protein [Edaphobacter sp.]
WEALRVSVHCAVRLFGPRTEYVICVNTVGLESAQQRAGVLPECVCWLEVSSADVPSFLLPYLGQAMAEGVGWKLVPTRIFPDAYELSLDNDCILWQKPTVLDQWLGNANRTLLAEDMQRCLGHFQSSSVQGPINSGIRGLPPGFALAVALRETLEEESLRLGHPVALESELDEQGLQAVALSRHSPSLLVSVREVTICSPFWPREPELGTCGAHFVGLNSRHIPWDYFGRPATVVRCEHWDRHRPELYRRAGLELTPALPVNETASR